MKFFSATCSRRDILKVATSTAIVTITSAFSSGCSPKIADMETIAKKMTGELNHPQKAREIARQICKIQPDEEDPCHSIAKQILAEQDK